MADAARRNRISPELEDWLLGLRPAAERADRAIALDSLDDVEPADAAARWILHCFRYDEGLTSPAAPAHEVALRTPTHGAPLALAAFELVWRYGDPIFTHFEKVAELGVRGAPRAWLALCRRATEEHWPRAWPATVAAHAVRATVSALAIVPDQREPVLAELRFLVDRLATRGPDVVRTISLLVEADPVSPDGPPLGRAIASELARHWLRHRMRDRPILNLRDIHDPIGADFLLAAVQAHAAWNLKSVAFNQHNGTDQHQFVRNLARAVPGPSDVLPELADVLRTQPRASLLALLPLAVHLRPVLLSALDLTRGEALVALVTEDGYADTGGWTSEEGVPEAPDPLRCREAWATAGDKAAKAVLGAFSKAAYGRRKIALIEAACGRRDAWIQERWAKRDRVAVVALGVAPLPADDALDAAVARVRALTEFRRGAKQFGSSKRPAEELAVDLSLAALAAQLGMTSSRLALVALTEESAAPPAWQIGDVDVVIEPRGRDVRLVVSRQGRTLRSVPRDVREASAWEEVKRARDGLAERWRTGREVVERLLVEAVPVEAAETARLGRDWMTVALFAGLVGRGADGAIGRIELDGPLLAGLRSAHPLQHPLRVLHPADLGDELQAWQDEVVRLGLTPSVPQVFRHVYLVAPGRSDDRSTDRFAGRPIDTRRAGGLFKARGWGGPDGEGEPMHRRFDAAGITAEWELEGLEHHVGLEAAVRSGPLSFRGPDGAVLALGDVPPSIYSEACRDVDLVVSVAGTGEAALTDPSVAEASAEVQAVRRQLIASVVRVRGLTNVRLDGTVATVEGSRGRYTVNLHAGLAYLEPTKRALDVPDAALDLSGPVEATAADAEPTLARTLALVRFLAADDQITDAGVLAQLAG